MLKRGDTGQEAERDWNFVACEFRGLHGGGKKPQDEKYFVQSVSLENSFDRRVVCSLVDCVSELSNDKLSRKPIRNSFLDPLHSYICCRSSNRYQRPFINRGKRRTFAFMVRMT